MKTCNKGKTYIKAERIANQLNIPFEMLKWTMDKYTQTDNLKKGVDYVVCENDMYLTLSGLLWVVARCDVDFRAAVPLAEKLASDNELIKSHNELLKVLPELQTALQLAQETIDSALQEAVSVTEPKAKTTYYAKNSPNLPDLDDEQKKWSADMTELLGKKAKEFNKMGVHIQKRIYSTMTSRYGIVWEQEKIDTLRKFGLDPEERMTTFRCVTYNPQLRSIYGALLKDFTCND